MAIEEQVHLERAPDPMDEASQIQNLTVSAAVTAIRAEMTRASKAPSRPDCLECGENIPEQRQRAVQGVQHCVPCAEIIDLRNKGVRRV
jgi:phage/conjugal plasmid C-4 type zinc finger TraR family protein